MTNEDKLQLASSLLLQRVASLTAELVNIQVDMEILKISNKELSEELKALKDKELSP